MDLQITPNATAERDKENISIDAAAEAVSSLNSGNAALYGCPAGGPLPCRRHLTSTCSFWHTSFAPVPWLEHPLSTSTDKFLHPLQESHSQRPALTETRAIAIAKDLYGLTVVSCQELPSYDDRNFMLCCDGDGVTVEYLLKAYNSKDSTNTSFIRVRRCPSSVVRFGSHYHFFVFCNSFWGSSSFSHSVTNSLLPGNRPKTLQWKCCT
jgi:hypothetical protein